MVGHTFLVKKGKEATNVADAYKWCALIIRKVCSNPSARKPTFNSFSSQFMEAVQVAL